MEEHRMPSFYYEDPKSNKKEFIPLSLKKLEINYLNPVLQFLGVIRNFKDFFLSNSGIFMEEFKKYRLSFITAKFYIHLYFDDNEEKLIKPYDTSSYLKILNIINPLFGTVKNMNVNQVLTSILYILDDENNKTDINEGIRNYNRHNENEVINNGIRFFEEKNNTIITKELNYYRLQTIECEYCHNIYFDMKSFPTFNINISYTYNKKASPITIKDCLENEKTNNGESIQFYCDSCNSYMETKMIKYQFYKTNNKLIFLLDRDACFNNSNNSVNIPFKIDEILGMKNYMIDSRQGFKYELIGIISSEIKEKRYVCFSKMYINQKWYLYIDELTEQKTIEEIINEHNNGKYIPYTLMYSKIN